MTAYIVDSIISHRDHLKAILRGHSELYGTISASREILADAANEIDRLLLENLHLREALTALVDEHCDYMLINHLGNPEEQHNIKLARAALKGAPHE